MLDDRYRARWNPARLGPFELFERDDPRRLDALAGELLARYAGDGDVEAFALLCELTGPRLRGLAERVIRRFGLPQRPELLVDALRRELFRRADTRALAFARAHFLAWARERLLTRARALDARLNGEIARPAGVGGLPDAEPGICMSSDPSTCGGPDRAAFTAAEYKLYNLYKK